MPMQQQQHQQHHHRQQHQRRLRHRRRRSNLERDAASRTYNGNGMSGHNLPPLPTTEAVEYDDVAIQTNDANDDDDDGGGGGGCSTLFGHPYGALPYGNIHLAIDDENDQQPPDRVRQSGLGPYFRILNDEQLISILSFVDGVTLANGIVRTSRFMYVAGHHEELWRDLVLRTSWAKGEEEGFIVPTPNTTTTTIITTTTTTMNTDDTIDGKVVVVNTPSFVRAKKRYTGCWKDIYAYNYYHYHHGTSIRREKSQYPQYPQVLLQHSPIHISGIYSDTFFRSWLCRSFALQPSWLTTQTVPKLQHTNITTEIFLDYETQNIPLLIEGATTTWKAMTKWKDHQYWINTCQNSKFRATSGAAPLPTSFTIQNYFHYCASSTEESPLYLFDRSFGSKVPQLLDDFESDLKRTCPWWDSNANQYGHDLFSVLGEDRRPDYQWLIVGPKRSGSCFHIDPNCTHAWNVPILGRKRWIFYPPGVTPPGIFPSPDGDDVCMPISIGEWFLTYWEEHVQRRMDPDVSKRPLECTVCPGDALFVPHGWWHMVLNIGDDDDDNDNDENACIIDENNVVGEQVLLSQKDPLLQGVSIALTRNYVSASNLPDVLRFLDTKVSQISGCRDREEAVKPEDLGKEFRNALMTVVSGTEQHNSHCESNGDFDAGGKGRWVNLLKQSELRAKEGWSCKAWVDNASSSSSSSSSSVNNDESSATTGPVNQRCFDLTKKRKRKIGTSILERAKQTTLMNSSCDAVVSSSEVGSDFSFSFFS